jgi:hypothetical protein
MIKDRCSEIKLTGKMAYYTHFYKALKVIEHMMEDMTR